MALPDGFARAYEELEELVARLSLGEVREEVLGEEVDAYVREECRGSTTLARAAALALHYELASEGLRESPEDVNKDLRALERVGAILWPHSEQRPADGEPAAPVEVALPEELRERMPRGRGFRMGELQIIFEQTEGPPHGHLSVSHPGRYPTIEELLRARTAPGGSPPNLWAWLPKPDELKGMQPHTVHLYVLPPKEFLG